MCYIDVIEVSDFHWLFSLLKNIKMTYVSSHSMIFLALICDIILLLESDLVSIAMRNPHY